jgi:prepilin-type processing-associated H-X9-DG protein
MTATLNRIASLWFDWQWAMLWQTAVPIGLVAVVDRLIRKRAWPQLRHALWLLVLVKLVLPPTLASPLSVTSRIPALAQAAVQPGPSSVDASPGQSLPDTSAGLPDERGRSHLGAGAAGLSTTQTEASAAALVEGEPAARAAPKFPACGASAISWKVYALGVWLAGVLILAAGLCVRLRQLSVEHSEAQPPDMPAWFDDALAEAAATLGLKRVPQVVFSLRICCPAVFGVIRPVLLFPTDHSAMTRQETRHILLHELAHIKRGDLLGHAGYMVLVTVYWLNPLLWLIRKHIQNLRELCCDATVARHLRGETAAYRDTLLRLGRSLLARPVDPGLGLLGLFENSGWLPVRLQWLQRKTWRHPWRRQTLIAVVSVVMLCCILPMASIKATDEKASNQSFRVALLGGGTIELIGVRKTGTDEWWRPDGTPLAEAPYDSSAQTNLSDAWEFALRYENLPKDSAGGMNVEPGGAGGHGTIPMWYASPQKAGRPVEGTTYVIASPAQKTDTVTVQVRLATGAWKTDAMNPRSSHGWNARTGGGATIGGVVFSAPYERDGKTYATVTYAAKKPNEYDVRLTALDVNNVEHLSDYKGGLWTGAGFKQITPHFDLPLDDIAAFNLQIRVYTWVEFKNVSLHPGEQQKVEIVMTEPNQVDTNNWRDTFQGDVDASRAWSAKVLDTFYTTCTGYWEENPGKELPKRPWLLQFRLTDRALPDDRNEPAYVAPLSYVTHAEYFRPGGFPALRRADFESTEAKHTPILHLKPLLETESGKGTNVLFGDGHIEWVTAEGLEKLKLVFSQRGP